jgi:hypothetical protein
LTSLPYLPTKIQSQGTNWKASIFWGVILGLLAFGLYQYREPILTWLNNPQLDLTQWIEKLTLDNIVAFLKDYGFLITAGAAAFTFIYGFYQKHQANKAALQLVTAQQNANSEINSAYASAEQYKRQAETYRLQLEQATTSDSQEALIESQRLVSSKEEQIKNLTGQVEALNNLVENLKVKVKETTVVK